MSIDIITKNIPNKPKYQFGVSDRQSIAVTDVISEGPIYGLVDGQASIFLDDDRACPLDQAAVHANDTPMRATLTNGATSVTISNGGANPVLNATNGNKYLIVRGGAGSVRVIASDGSAGDANGNQTCILTTNFPGGSNPAFWNADMVSTPADTDTHIPIRLQHLAGAGVGYVDSSFGEGYLIAVTSSTVAEFQVGSFFPAGNWIPDGVYLAYVDRIVKISSISGTTITLAAAWTGTTGAYTFDVSGAVTSDVDIIDQTAIATYEGVTTQFRVGTLNQGPFTGQGGTGSTAVSNAPSGANGGAFEQTTGFSVGGGSGSQDPKELIGSSSAGFNLTASQLKEVDEARVSISYGGGHYAVSGKGNEVSTTTTYKIELAIKKIGSSSFESSIVLHENKYHRGEYRNSTTFIERIDLTKFRPFADFKVILSRKTNHTGPGYDSATTTFHDWQNATASNISSTTCLLKEILTHPYTAMAKVTFSTKQFQGMPTRSYHARGLKVLVPSNYITREEAGGVANYYRNVTDESIETTYQDWDGAFRTDKVYTNNPAWVFYDILTNNRYGLGDFLSATDVDKYTLYRIARYCDELVNDGREGLEPRFTANLFFTKQADAYKVLKDIATVFRSMLYFLDGQVVPVIDAPSGPVYNFTKANVIDGKFSYESTGSKTRINQVIVSWNNPEANYKLEPLIVEDRINIAQTGKLISQSSVAMGATSEGQALRYGRWKLWTAANQREVCSFVTGINASFLLPGDIINVQDADRYAVRYGGRISNTGTDPSTTSIPLDNTTTLVSGSTYDLAIIFVEPGAFATETVSITDNAGTPVTTTYNKGDLIKKAWIKSSGASSYTYQNIDTEEKAVNAKADATNADAIVLNWADTTRVESKPVSTSAGAVDTLTVSSAFTAVPAAESIWVLTETAEGAVVSSSAKEYKILALSQNSKNETTVTAVEHFDAKFAAVDEDFTTYIADTVYPTITSTSTIPPVIDINSKSKLQPNGLGEELVISWTPPSSGVAGFGTGESYEHIKGYELTHNFPKVASPIRLKNPTSTSWLIRDVLPGNYKAAVRVVNTLNNLSTPVTAYINISNKFSENIPRMPNGIPYSGGLSCSVLQDTSTFKIAVAAFTYNHPSSLGKTIINTSTSAATYQQDCIGLPVITQTTQTEDSEFIIAHSYLLMDSSDATDRLKLIKYYKPTTVGTPFWYDTGTGGGTSKYGSALTGTFTKSINSSKVTGSNTSFTTEIQAGDVLKIGTDEIVVASVQSDTALSLTQASENAHSAVSGYIPNIRIDFINDAIIAKVYRTSSGFFMEAYVTEDGDAGADGDEGIGNTTVYRETSSAPSTPGSGTTNPPTSWYATVALAKAAVSGTALIWFSVGSKPAGSTTWTWNTPIRYVEIWDDVGSRPAELTDGRIALGLASSGNVNRAVPQSVGGTGLTSNATILNSAVDKAHVGLSNVANETRATILGGDLTGSLNASSFPMRAMVTGANAAAVKTTIALQNVDNTSDNTIRAGNITGTVNSVAVATISSGAVLGNSSNQDSTSTILGGELTGSLNATAFPMKAMVTGANAAAVKTTIALQNVDNTSDNTIRAGNITGTVNSVAVATISSGAVLGNSSNQDSTSSIRSGTTAANVGLGNVTNESKATMLTSPAITGTPTGVSKTHVGLANVDNTSDNTIRAGNITGTIGNTANAIVAVAHTKAGTETNVSGTARTFMNENGLIVKDASNVIRVKIGNLSAL